MAKNSGRQKRAKSISSDVVDSLAPNTDSAPSVDPNRMSEDTAYSLAESETFDSSQNVSEDYSS